MSNQPFKLGLSLIFTDQSYDQISMLRAFFLRRRIKTSNLLRTSQGTAWIVVVSRHDSVLTTLKKMRLFLYKKSNEADAAIAYYEGKTTGNGLVEMFRQEVEAGRRERREHRVRIDVPLTLPEGERLMHERRGERLRDALGRFRAKVSSADYWSVRRAAAEGLRLRDLVKRYPRYSRETIRRILGKGRSYVGVKGVGRVDATDTAIRDPSAARIEIGC